MLVDARDLDPPEATYLATSRVKRRTVDDIRAEDLPDGPVILHIDVDVIDAAEVPGLRFPVSGGPSSSAVIAAVRRLLAGGRVSIVHVPCTWYEPTTEDEQAVRRVLLDEILGLR